MTDGGSSFGCGVWQYETLKHKRQKMNHKILECKWNNPMELKQAWLSAWVLQMLSMLGCWMVQPTSLIIYNILPSWLMLIRFI